MRRAPSSQARRREVVVEGHATASRGSNQSAHAAHQPRVPHPNLTDLSTGRRRLGCPVSSSREIYILQTDRKELSYTRLINRLTIYSYHSQEPPFQTKGPRRTRAEVDPQPQCACPELYEYREHDEYIGVLFSPMSHDSDTTLSAFGFKRDLLTDACSRSTDDVITVKGDR